MSRGKQKYDKSLPKELQLASTAPGSLLAFMNFGSKGHFGNRRVLAFEENPKDFITKVVGLFPLYHIM